MDDHTTPCKDVIIASERITSIEKSVDVAKAELDRRLDAMNEIRAQLDAQARMFMTREEICAQQALLTNKIDTVRAELDKRQGAGKWSDHIITVLIGAAVLFLMWMMTSGKITG